MNCRGGFSARIPNSGKFEVALEMMFVLFATSLAYKPSTISTSTVHPIYYSKLQQSITSITSITRIAKHPPSNSLHTRDAVSVNCQIGDHGIYTFPSLLLYWTGSRSPMDQTQLSGIGSVRFEHEETHELTSLFILVAASSSSDGANLWAVLHLYSGVESKREVFRYSQTQPAKSSNTNKFNGSSNW